MPTSVHVQMIAPTQQTVVQTKSIINQEDEELKDMIGSTAIKRKHKSNLNQTKAKHQKQEQANQKRKKNAGQLRRKLLRK